MRKMVITGGPCAGKTTALNAIKQEFAGQVLAVPEAATLLLSGGFPTPVAWSPKWQLVFQDTIFPLQIRLEKACKLVAIEQGISLLVCDRGTLDGAAYFPGGVPEFCHRYGVDRSNQLAHYKAVIHFESLAIADPEKYRRIRKDSSLERDQQLEMAIREAWDWHPRLYFIKGEWEIAEKIRQVTTIIQSLLLEGGV